MTSNELINDVFDSWRVHLARIVSRIVPPHDIEDIVQETYVRACQFDPREKIRSPGAFLTSIARNLALDHVKRAEARLTNSIGSDFDLEKYDLDHESDGPLCQLVSKEEFAHFCEAVRLLPVQCRRVFVLKKVYGYSQREIARILNLSESTIEKHIAKGIKLCTLYMRENYGGSVYQPKDSMCGTRGN